MPLEVGGLIKRRIQGEVVLRGDVDASLAANLPSSASAGDRYKVTVYGDFEGSPLIAPAGVTFDVGDQIERQLSGAWLKIDAGQNIIDDPYGASWQNDTDNTSSRKRQWDKHEAEQSAREAADTAEAAARTAADGALQTNIDAEQTAREGADTTLQANIDAEAGTRAGADTTLQGNIDTEEAARIAADGTLQGNIDQEVTDRTTAVSGEASARSTADNTLQQNIDNESSSRVGADNLLQANIDSLESTVGTDFDNIQQQINNITNDNSTQTSLDAEESARIAADAALQSQIDAMASDGAMDDRVSDLEERVHKDEVMISEHGAYTFSLDSANRDGFDNTTYSYTDSTPGNDSTFESNLRDATLDIQAFSSPQSYHLTITSGTDFIGVMRPTGIPLDQAGIISKVEVSSNDSEWEEVETEDYWRYYFEKAIDDGDWDEGEIIYVHVNRNRHQYLKVTFDGYNGSTFSLVQVKPYTRGVLYALDRFDFSPTDFGDQSEIAIDPGAFVSDTGDRWVFVQTDSSNFGSAGAMLHESYFRTLPPITFSSYLRLFVDGGNFSGKISSYAKTLRITPDSIEARTGEQLDLRGNVLVNGEPIAGDMTGVDIVASIDAELGSSAWQSQLTGAQIVAALDSQLGSSDWQTQNADQTGSEIVAAIDSLLGNSDWQTPGGGAASTSSQISEEVLFKMGAALDKYTEFTSIDVGASYEAVKALCYCGHGKYLIGTGTDAGDADIHVSDDYGKTFSYLSTPGAAYTLVESICYLGKGRVLCGVGNGANQGDVFISDDYGATWTQSSGTIGDYQIAQGLAYAGNGICFVCGGGSAWEGDVFKSTDYGDTWTISFQNSDYDHNSGRVACAENGCAAVALSGVYGKIMVTDDYGATWTTGAAENFEINGYYDISYLGEGLFIATGWGKTVPIDGNYPGKIARSTDYGATWTTYNLTTAQRYPICPVPLRDGKIGLWMREFNGSGGFYVSEDRGLTWALKWDLDSSITTINNRCSWTSEKGELLVGVQGATGFGDVWRADI